MNKQQLIKDLETANGVIVDLRARLRDLGDSYREKSTEMDKVTEALSSSNKHSSMYRDLKTAIDPFIYEGVHDYLLANPVEMDDDGVMDIVNDQFYLRDHIDDISGDIEDIASGVLEDDLKEIMQDIRREIIEGVADAESAARDAIQDHINAQDVNGEPVDGMDFESAEGSSRLERMVRDIVGHMVESGSISLAHYPGGGHPTLIER